MEQNHLDWKALFSSNWFTFVIGNLETWLSTMKKKLQWHNICKQFANCVTDLDFILELLFFSSSSAHFKPDADVALKNCQ